MQMITFRDPYVTVKTQESAKDDKESQVYKVTAKIENTVAQELVD